MACLDDDFDACIAHLRFPLAHRRVTRTTNLLERLFGEERRRTKAIPHAFGERAVLKLMYAALGACRRTRAWHQDVIHKTGPDRPTHVLELHGQAAVVIAGRRIEAKRKRHRYGEAGEMSILLNMPSSGLYVR